VVKVGEFIARVFRQPQAEASPGMAAEAVEQILVVNLKAADQGLAVTVVMAE